jgi:hypothetical protein
MDWAFDQGNMLALDLEFLQQLHTCSKNAFDIQIPLQFQKNTRHRELAGDFVIRLNLTGSGRTVGANFCRWSQGEGGPLAILPSRRF